jgi:hypothetical protein
MGLSCFCDEDSIDCYANSEKNFRIIEKNDVCHSCKKTIESGDFILAFETWTIDESGDEIYGEGFFFCEKCGEYYWNLEDLGFCVNLDNNMQDLVAEYRELFLNKG